jgi:glutamate racemase
LACTHYSFIKKEISANIDNNINIIDSSSVVVDKTVKYLKKHKQIKIKKEPITVFYTSGDLLKFTKISKKLLKKINNRSFKFLKDSTFTNN